MNPTSLLWGTSKHPPAFIANRMNPAMKCPLLSALTLSLAFCFSAQAAKTTPLLDAETSWNGGTFHYPEGTPKVTAVKIRLKQGESTAIHCHPVPLFAYILKGHLRVTTGLGQSRVFKRGEAMVEVMDTWHQGKAIRGPVELVAFYAGAEGIPVTELEGADNGDCQP